MTENRKIRAFRRPGDKPALVGQMWFWLALAAALALAARTLATGALR